MDIPTSVKLLNPDEGHGSIAHFLHFTSGAGQTHEPVQYVLHGWNEFYFGYLTRMT